MRNIFFLFLLALATSFTCEGQTKVSTDSTARVKPVKWQPNAKKAGLYAALIPGLGQIYNRQYWKLPIVYGGLGAAGYFVYKNSTDYTKLRKAYVGRIGAAASHTTPNDEYVGIYSTDQLQQLQSDQNRILNMTVIYTSLAFAVQVLDAVTSAHLRNFDISRDISMQVKPVPTPFGAGIGIAMTF